MICISSILTLQYENNNYHNNLTHKKTIIIKIKIYTYVPKMYLQFVLIIKQKQELKHLQ